MCWTTCRRGCGGEGFVHCERIRKRGHRCSSGRMHMITKPSPLQVRSIAYATPAPREPRRWFSLRTTLLALLVTGIVQIDLLFTLQFKQRFLDFHVKLPGLTRLLLAVAVWWNAEFGWAIVWPLAIALPIGMTFLRHRHRGGNEATKWLLLAMLVFVAFICCLVLTILAVYFPTIDAVQLR
jgi:hypothetical protein